MLKERIRNVFQHCFVWEALPRELAVEKFNCNNNAVFCLTTEALEKTISTSFDSAQGKPLSSPGSDWRNRTKHP